MSIIKISMVLWITYLILTKSSDEIINEEILKEQDMKISFFRRHVVLKPGRNGIVRFGWGDGTIQSVSKDVAQQSLLDAKITETWKIITIDHQPFSEELLIEKQESLENYTIELIWDLQKLPDKKLIEYAMEEDEDKRTVLHHASSEGHEKIVKLLLNAFCEDNNEKLIEYLMKEDKDKRTVLHHASINGHEKIVKLLVKAFGEDNNKKLIEFLTKKDKMFDSLTYALMKRYEEISNFLLKAFLAHSK